MTSAHRLLIVLACSALMGCGSSADLKDKLGLNHQAPDEFRVLPRPPLSVPPEFNLRPPGEESEYVSGAPSQSKAHDEVLGTASVRSPSASLSETAVTPVTSGELPTSADSQLLSQAGASKADPKIRQKLLDDKLNGVAEKDPNYLFGGKKENDTLVDAPKEADRIKQDKAQNKPVTAGDTPVVPTQDKGILGDIF